MSWPIQELRPQEILHATGPLPTFEVATVKPAGPDTGPSAAMIAEGAATDKLSPTIAAAPNGEKVTRQVTVIYAFTNGPSSDRVEMTFKTRILIRAAYGLPRSAESRIIGGPAWLDNDNDRYEVNARIDRRRFAAMQKMYPRRTVPARSSDGAVPPRRPFPPQGPL